MDTYHWFCRVGIMLPVYLLIIEPFSTMKQGVLAIKGVKLLANCLYDKIRTNKIPGPIFNEWIKDRWWENRKKMYRFWQTVLPGEHTCYGNTFSPHAQLPVGHEDFLKFLQLLNSSVDESFTGEKARVSRWRAAKTAEMFEKK